MDGAGITLSQCSDWLIFTVLLCTNEKCPYQFPSFPNQGKRKYFSNICAIFTKERKREKQILSPDKIVQVEGGQNLRN